MGQLRRRQLSALIIVLVLIRGLELGAALVGVRWMDRQQYISERRFVAALLTTYHSPDRGLPEVISFTELAEVNTLIAQPRKCVPLVVPTSISHVTRAGRWSGTVGDQRQWVIIMTVRFSSAADARRALLSERVALLRCPVIRATSPPFDQLSELYRVSRHSAVWPPRWDRVRYTLSGEDSYEFYVRQFANTLTWTSGNADNKKSSTARAQAVDSLVARLGELGGRR